MSTDRPAIAALRDRVQLLHKEQTAEPEGGHATVYVPLATVWARVHARPASRSDFADARGAKATHTVVVRYRSDVASGDRIAWRGRKLEVLSVEDLNGRPGYLSCACTETRVTA